MYYHDYILQTQFVTMVVGLQHGTTCGEYREIEKIPENFVTDSGECSRRFLEMLLKIKGNVIKKILRNAQKGDVPKDSGECSGRFQFI